MGKKRKRERERRRDDGTPTFFLTHFFSHSFERCHIEEKVCTLSSFFSHVRYLRKKKEEKTLTHHKTRGRATRERERERGTGKRRRCIFFARANDQSFPYVRSFVRSFVRSSIAFFLRTITPAKGRYY